MCTLLGLVYSDIADVHFHYGQGSETLLLPAGSHPSNLGDFADHAPRLRPPGFHFSCLASGAYTLVDILHSGRGGAYIIESSLVYCVATLMG